MTLCSPAPIDPSSKRHVPGPDDPLRIAYLTYRGKPHVGGQGVYTRHLTQGAGRPRPPRRGARRPAVSRSSTSGSRCIELPSLDIYNDYFPMRMPGLWELKTLDGLRRGHVVLDRHVPRAAGVLAAGLGPPAPAGSTSSTSSRTTSASATACWRSSASGLPVLGTIHHPITVDRRLEMEHAETRWQRMSKARWYAFTKMQTRVAKRLRRIITVSQNSLRRHLPRPQRSRPSSCTSCPSASTPTCSARSRASQRDPDQHHLDRLGRRGDEGPAIPARGAGQAAHRAPRAEARDDRPAQGRVGRASARSSELGLARRRRVRLRRDRRAHRRALQRVGLRRRPVAVRGLLAARHRGDEHRRARWSPPPAARSPRSPAPTARPASRSARRQRGARGRHPPGARRHPAAPSASARPAGSASSTDGAGDTLLCAPSSTTGPCLSDELEIATGRSAHRRLRQSSAWTPGELVLDMGAGAGRHAFESLPAGRAGRRPRLLLRRAEAGPRPVLGHGRGRRGRRRAPRRLRATATPSGLPFPDDTFDRIICSRGARAHPRRPRRHGRARPGAQAGRDDRRHRAGWLPEKICWALSAEYHAPLVRGRPRADLHRGPAARARSRRRPRPGGSHRAHALHSPVLVAALRWSGRPTTSTPRQGLPPPAGVGHRQGPVRHPLRRTVLNPVLGKSVVVYSTQARRQRAAGTVRRCLRTSGDAPCGCVTSTHRRTIVTPRACEDGRPHRRHAARLRHGAVVPGRARRSVEPHARRSWRSRSAVAGPRPSAASTGSRSKQRARRLLAPVLPGRPGRAGQARRQLRRLRGRRRRGTTGCCPATGASSRRCGRSVDAAIEFVLDAADAARRDHLGPPRRRHAVVVRPADRLVVACATACAAPIADRREARPRAPRLGARRPLAWPASSATSPTPSPPSTAGRWTGTTRCWPA